jgi:hypothetical protein
MENKQIALLFLIYDIINQEELWYKWLLNVDKKKYSIYIHYKYDVKLKYFEEYKLKNCIETEYCKTSIILAQNLLLETALQDQKNYKLITLSQACIPIKTFDYIYNKLILDDLSYFNITSGNIQDEIFPRCNELLRYFDKEIIKKSSNWFILERGIAQEMLNNVDIIKYFENIYCPEEHYYIMVIYLKKLDNNIIFNNKISELTTFTNWFYNKEYKFLLQEYDSKLYKRGLRNYFSIPLDEISYILNLNCLFARKFNSTCIVYSRKPKMNVKLDDFIINRWSN